MGNCEKWSSRSFLSMALNVVLTGHDHVYERIKPQKGIYYFVSGAGGKLRTGDIERDVGVNGEVVRSRSALHVV